jgi:hypothetical protein
MHVWGRAVEQDLDYLHPGSDVWYERCELAADLYRYEKSARVRRLYALTDVLLSGQVNEANHGSVGQVAGRREAQTIDEIG